MKHSGHRSRFFFRRVVHINGTSLRYGGRGKPLPCGSPEALPGLGRGGPWASRQDAHQKREYVKSWTGGSRTRPYAPHPPRFARHLPLKGKAFGRLIAVLSFRRGRTLAGPQMYTARPGGAPYGSAPAAACSAKPGAVVKPYQLQFWNSQPPVGRRGQAPALPDLLLINSSLIEKGLWERTAKFPGAI